MRSALNGTAPRADIALLHTYDSRWAIDFQPHTRAYDQQQALLRFYKPLENVAASNGDAIDIIDPTRASLDGYKLLVAPSLNVIDGTLGAKLVTWVKAGGHLLLGPRSGMKDQFNSLNTQSQPGPLASSLGAKVEQYYALDQKIHLIARTESLLLSPDPTADIWAEGLSLETPDTSVNLEYLDPRGWLDHRPAMVTRSVGRGSISYLGTLPDAATLDAILRHVANGAGIKTENAPPQNGIELCKRVSRDGHRSVLIAINHSGKPATVTFSIRYKNLLQSKREGSTVAALSRTGTTVMLPSQGIAVLVPEGQP